MRTTENEQLPREWQVEKLGDISRIIMGQSPPGSSYNTSGVGKPFLQGKAEFGEVSPRNTKFTTSPMKVAREGDVLLSVRAPVGDVNIADKEYCIGRGLASISMPDDDNRYLFFCLMRQKERLASKGHGSIFKSIGGPELRGFEIPFPPAKEQKRISSVLSSVEEAKEKTQAVIDATRALKKSMMKYLFTYGLVPFTDAEDVQLKETYCGLIPEHWGIKRIKEIADTYSGGTPSRDLKEYWNGDIPWLKSGELRDGLVVGASEFITRKGIENSSVKFVEPGTLLIAMYGATAGRVGISGLKATINQAICAVKPMSTVDTHFLFYSLVNNRSGLLAKRYGGAQPNLNQQTIRDLEIPIPPLEEQRRISDVLGKIDAKCHANEMKKESHQAVFITLLNSLMTGKLRLKNLEVPT